MYLACYYTFPICSFWWGTVSTAVIYGAKSLTLAFYPTVRGDAAATVCAFIKASAGPKSNHNPCAPLPPSPGPWGPFCTGTSAWELALHIPIWPRGPDLPSQTSLSLRALLCQEPTRGLQTASVCWCLMLGKSIEGCQIQQCSSLRRQNNTFPFLPTATAPALPPHAGVGSLPHSSLAAPHQWSLLALSWEAWRLSSLSFAKHLDSLWGLQ